MNRRDFFKFLPLAPAILPAVAIAKSREGDEPRKGEFNIQIHGTKEPRKVETNYPHIGGLNFNLIEQDPDKVVSMSIGQDGHLWLKTAKDEWKRVVTE